MTTEIDQIMLNGARQQVIALEASLQSQPNSHYITTMLEQQRTQVRNLEIKMGVAATPAAPGQQLPIEKLEAWAQTVESRFTQLEQLVKQAAPAVNEAAQAGMAIMSALGQAMTPDQAQILQKRLQSSPQFLATQDARDVVGILLDSWDNFEGAKA